MKKRRIIGISFSIIVVFMSLSDTIEAQNGMDDETVYITNKWKHSRKGEIEHYKDYIPEIIPEYFILGTASSYMGRSYLGLKEDQLNFYWDGEDSMAYCMKKYLKDKFGIDIEIKKNERNSIGTYSSEWTKKISGYFDETGSIKNDIFRTDEEIYSFLLGVYYRYGYKITDSIYKIQVNNSPDPQVIYSLLNKVGCDKIVYNRKRNLILVPTLFYFESSVLLEKYFNSIESKYIGKKEIKSKYRQEEKEMIESSPFFK